MEPCEQVGFVTKSKPIIYLQRLQPSNQSRTPAPPSTKPATSPALPPQPAVYLDVMTLLQANLSIRGPAEPSTTTLLPYLLSPTNDQHVPCARRLVHDALHLQLLRSGLQRFQVPLDFCQNCLLVRLGVEPGPCSRLVPLPLGCPHNSPARLHLDTHDVRLVET